ncbi:MAG: hypothetical protein H7A33_07825 [Deltaproteobacteria bacterium]|nr:hypothetical protein [Deltaproteobacteria bacterium]
MSTVSTIDYQDLSVEAFEDTFGVSVKFDDLVEMSDDELKSFVESLCAEAGISEEDFESFLESLEEDVDDCYAKVYAAHKELEAILDSDNMLVSDQASIELTLKELEEWMDKLDGKLVDSSEEGFEESQEKLIDGSDGGAVSFSESSTDPKNGDVFKVTLKDESGSSETGTMINDPHADWVDTDGDGYGDTDPELDSEGHATKDTNGDGVVTEADEVDYVDPNATQVVSLDIDGTIEGVVEDSETGELKIACRTEDGDLYYLVFENWSADANVAFVLTGGSAGLSADTLSAMPDAFLSKFFESEATYNSGKDAYELLNGTDLEGASADVYSRYYMEELDNTASISPSSSDFENNREYEIYGQDHIEDNIALNFPDDAELAFSTDAAGNLVLTATTDEGSITITFFGIQGSNLPGSDVITITGGELDESSIGAIGESNVELLHGDTSFLYDVFNFESSLFSELYDIEEDEEESSGSSSFMDTLREGGSRRNKAFLS